MNYTRISINFENLNRSLQVGDTAYKSDVLSGGILSTPSIIGEIVEISNSGIVVKGDVANAPVENQFISFSKHIQANESSLKGYYADVTFKNSSNKYAELFAVSSETVISSK